MKKVDPRTPICSACGAKHAHSVGLAQCRKCGLPDEVLAAGHKAVQAWQEAHGLKVSRGGSFQRRRRAHGRPRGGSKRRRVRA